MKGIINKCLCCGNSSLYLCLDLNSQPLANSYLKSLEEEEEIYPLGINFCQKCSHIQLTHAVDPDKLFKDYLYVSGTTKTGKDYFDWFVPFAKKFTEGKKVLDIACNDGSQLDSFKKQNFDTYGIDPAENLYELSSKNHNVVCDYLTDESINNFNTKFDIIIAQNVFAHNTYPAKFLDLCKKQLADKGHIFIQTSQADMVANNQFDTIYHEHVSFFSVKSFSTLAKKVGLKLVEVKRTPIHGTSFLFVLSKEGLDNSEKYISNEINLNIEKINIYSDNCRQIAIQTFERISQIRQEGYKVIGYGAAAKGNTFLNFSKIKLDYIIDDNPLKHGLYAPGSKIPILSPEKLKQEKTKLCIVPLAWNFFDEIKDRVQRKSLSNCVFLKYYPEVTLVKS